MRHGLLRAAVALAAEHGFSSLGLREVSREAGIAPTSFYRHFADMRELGLALIDELAAPMLEAAADTARKAWADGRDGTAVLIDQLQQAASEDPNLVRFVLSARHGATAEFRDRLREAAAGVASAALPRSEGAFPSALTQAVAAVLMTCCETRLDPQARALVNDALQRMVGPWRDERDA